MNPDLSALLDRVGLTGSDVARLLEVATDHMRAEVAAVIDEQASGSAFPVVNFADVAAGHVDDDALATIRRRGCVVLRGTFERELADRWDADIAEYLAANRFEEAFAERYPDAAASGSRIWGVYWSPAQVAARQHPNMEAARRFLNSFWHHESDGQTWFDPGRDIGYPDRLRRRAPSAAAAGLPPHSDAVSSGGWRFEENVKVFRHVFAGDFERYDPWDGAHRTSNDVTSAAPSSVFRTFQGWTALSEMHPSDGVLHVIPIPSVAAYMLVRGVAGELGLLTGEPEDTPVRFRADELALSATVPIPVVEPGDTVWWHGDLLHSVAPASNDTRWSNVMYIATTPSCPRNDAYRSSVFERFVGGLSPLDFPDEHFEAHFAGRPTVDDLNDVGRDHVGVAPATA